MQLGPITLSDHLILDGLENAPDIVHSQRRTLTGESVVQVGLMSGGRGLTLRTGGKMILLSEIQAIKNMASAGQPVILTHYRGQFTVLITGVDVTPAIDCANPPNDAWYTGTITMIEV